MGTCSRRRRYRSDPSVLPSGSRLALSGTGDSTLRVEEKCAPGDGWRTPPIRVASGPSGAGSILFVLEGVEDDVAAVVLGLTFLFRFGVLLQGRPPGGRLLPASLAKADTPGSSRTQLCRCTWLSSPPLGRSLRSGARPAGARSRDQIALRDPDA